MPTQRSSSRREAVADLRAEGERAGDRDGLVVRAPAQVLGRRAARRSACRDSSALPDPRRALNSRNACISSGPNITGRNSARAWPSPCSPESEPPYLTTSAAASPRKPRQCAMPSRRRQVEVDARVHAAVAEVAVDRGAVAVAVDQRAELAQVVAEAQRVHRRVLPANDRIGTARAEGERGRRCAGLADRPEAAHADAIRRSARRRTPASAACAVAIASSRDAPPNSTISQALPGGSSAMSSSASRARAGRR